eukprot:1932591-Prymnesium_polylepis.1
MPDDQQIQWNRDNPLESVGMGKDEASNHDGKGHSHVSLRSSERAYSTGSAFLIALFGRAFASASGSACVESSHASHIGDVIETLYILSAAASSQTQTLPMIVWR